MNKLVPVWLLIGLAGCGEADPSVIRPGTQPLERLNTPEARAKMARAEPSLSNLNPSQAQTMCTEIMRISEQGGLVLDRSDPRQLVVEGALWVRLPTEGKDAIVQCARAMRPTVVRNSPLRVVERR